MNLEQLVDYCLSKKSATEDLPFDKNTLVFKVGGKMFVLTSLSEWENGNSSINLKCNPEKAIELREQFASIIPGYHMSKVHWNTIQLFHDEISDSFLKELINHSYELVFKSLPKKVKEGI